MTKRTRYPTEQNISLSISSFDKGISTVLDQNLTSMNYAYDIKNFSFSDGALKNGIGFSSLTTHIVSEDKLDALNRDINNIGSILKIFHFYIFNSNTNSREDKLIFVNDELKLFYINLYEQNPSLNSIRSTTFTSTPVAKQYRLNGEDVIIFSSETDNMVVWNGTDEPYEVLDAPKISSMALHYERLFVTVDGEKNSIWFSDDLDPTNWSISLNEAGFIELIDERGAMLKVVSFCDYIYIFREYGISRLSAYGDQKNFAVSNLFVSSGKIFADSVCVCGDKILFMASDGLYRFDGVDTYKILDNITKNITNIENQAVTACYYNGNYYLACKYKFHNEDIDPNINCNALLEIDINTYKLKNVSYGVDIKYLCSIQTDKLSGVVALTDNKGAREYTPCILTNSGSYLSDNLLKEWLSPTSCLDKTSNLKILKKIYIETNGDITLTIYHDNNASTFSIKGSKSIAVKRVNIPCYNFAFKISTENNVCNIKNLRFVFASVNGRE